MELEPEPKLSESIAEAYGAGTRSKATARARRNTRSRLEFGRHKQAAKPEATNPEAGSQLFHPTMKLLEIFREGNQDTPLREVSRRCFEHPKVSDYSDFEKHQS